MISESLSKTILELNQLVIPSGIEFIPIAIEVNGIKFNFKLSIFDLLRLVPIPTKAQVGLGNVDNTSDFDKPISNATQSALNNKANTNHTHVVNDITDLLILLADYESKQIPGTVNDITEGTITNIRSWSPSIFNQIFKEISNKIIQDTKPDTVELKKGQEWLDSSTGINYTWYVDDDDVGYFLADLNPGFIISNSFTETSLKFNPNPVLDEEHIDGNNNKWKFNGKGWVSNNINEIPEATDQEAITASSTSIRSWSPSKILTLVENNTNQDVGLTSGIEMPLGLNTEGCFETEGLVLSESTKVTNAIALLNCIVGRMVPKEPIKFPGNNTLSLSLSQYRITDFIQTDNANDNLNVSGGTVINVIRSNSYSSNNITQTGPGTKGIIELYKNKNVFGSKQLTKTQNSITLLGDDNGVYNDLILTNDKDYNLIDSSILSGFHQVIDVRVSGTVNSGWNQIYIKHTEANETNKVNWYADLSNPGAPVFSNIQNISPNNPSLQYSSTIPHLDNTNLFTLSFNISHLSGDTYPLSDTFITGLAAGAFLTPASKTYQQAEIPTPLTRNLYVSSGFKTVTTTVGIRGGFGSSNLYPSLASNNSYGSTTQGFNQNAIVLYKTGNTSPLDETNIVINSVGFGSGNGIRIINPGSLDTPSITNTTVFDSQFGILTNYDATIVATILKHDQTNYSIGYLPVGPNLSQNRSGSQYFTFKFTRTIVAKFNIVYTGTIAGLWIALPGSNIDISSSINGWLDASVPYNGAGLPGAGSGGNGSNGCAVAGVAVLNSNQNNKAVTVTLGTENSSNTPTNEIIVRVKLTPGQSLTNFYISTATN